MGSAAVSGQRCFIFDIKEFCNFTDRSGFSPFEKVIQMRPTWSAPSIAETMFSSSFPLQIEALRVNGDTRDKARSWSSDAASR